MSKFRERINVCRGCKQSCCVDFKIGKEIRDPAGWKKELKRLPFIRQVDREAVLVGGFEKVVGVYTCDRLNSDGECGDYDDRPWFCRETGITGVPNEQCLLK